jgi:hypothetical protein
MKRWLVCGVVTMVQLTVMTFTLQAQVPTGTINGIVTDPHHAVVSGAHVTATEQTTGVIHETVSNGDGVYSIPELPAGMYDVRISASGFAVSEFQGVQLQAGRASTLDSELKLAAVGQSVDVTDVTNSIELTQSMIQGQITSSAIENIPPEWQKFSGACLSGSRQSSRAEFRSHEDEHLGSEFGRKRGTRRQYHRGWRRQQR